MWCPTYSRLLVAAALAGWMFLAPGTAWSAGDAPSGKPPIVKAHVHEGKKHEERKFDLSKEAEKKELMELLAKGAADEVVQVKEPDLLAIKGDLGVWSIIVFLLLFYVLSKYAWPLILEGLQKREANIHNAFAEAERTRKEAQELRQQFEQQIARANDTVREMLEEARRDAQQTTEDMLTKARGEIKAERDRLRREIDTAKDQALKEIWEHSVQLASVMSTKLIRRQLSTEDQRQILEESLAELQKVGSQQAPSKN